MQRSASRAAAVAALVSLALLAASCSSQVAPSTTTTTTTGAPSSSTTSSTSTTTTFPSVVAGTLILRARVAPLAPGTLVLPEVTEGSAAWLRMIPIAYRSFGTGPDLLMIPGQDGTMSWWGQRLLGALSAHYRVTIFDLPGVGYSGAPTARLSLAWLSDVVAGLSLTVGLSDPIVLGWGLGGQIALALVERHPGLASSLVLADTSAGGLGAAPPGSDVVRLLGHPGATPTALSKVMFPDTTAGQAAAQAWSRALFTGSTDWMTSHAVLSEAALQAGVWRHSAVVGRLSQVGIPVLVAAGSDDVVFPAPDATLLDEELLHVTELTLPGAGYAAIVQDEPAFVAGLERFTSENAPAGS